MRGTESLCSTSTAKAEETAADLRSQGHQALGARADVADRNSIEQAYARARSEFGPIEIVVTSAAVAGYAPFEEITLEDWDRTLAVNSDASSFCSGQTLYMSGGPAPQGGEF